LRNWHRRCARQDLDQPAFVRRIEVMDDDERNAWLDADLVKQFYPALST
jgi:hypothetical protein